MDHYEHVLLSWPAHERTLVSHRYGHTGVLVAGDLHHPPLVLLHGRYTPAPSWTPLIHELASRYRVYVIDTIGEPGISVNDGARIRTTEDYLASLINTLNGLGLTAAHLCGYSFGGWLAAQLAVRHPDRVASLTLLDPAQVFAPFSLRWLLHCVPPYLFPRESTVKRFFSWAGQGLSGHEDIVELGTLAMLSFRIKAPEASLVPKEQLRGLTMPVQQLLAEHSVVHSPGRVRQSAERINPAVRTLLVRDSSHFLIQNQPAQILEALDHLTAVATP
ncbi:alpha/beta fold hydrolase [Ruania zhangjianzhongii]|uniref:alpha/beta fold hydrolase n=1 Tax=Ruania zhangjianzhongii TaxID=2603206 RepID=UPI00143D896B|nr:alpha/beta hydrolase [Ruania zhangjianzhongii]